MEETIKSLEEQRFPAKKRNRLIIYVVVLFLMNVILYFIGPKTPAGEQMPKGALLFGIIISELAKIIIGFIIGTITALFLYKKLPYSKRYLPAALISTVVIFIITLLLEINNLIMFS